MKVAFKSPFEQEKPSGWSFWLAEANKSETGRSRREATLLARQVYFGATGNNLRIDIMKAARGLSNSSFSSSFVFIFLSAFL